MKRIRSRGDVDNGMTTAALPQTNRCATGRSWHEVAARLRTLKDQQAAAAAAGAHKGLNETVTRASCSASADMLQDVLRISAAAAVDYRSTCSAVANTSTTTEGW